MKLKVTVIENAKKIGKRPIKLYYLVLKARDKFDGISFSIWSKRYAKYA